MSDTPRYKTQPSSRPATSRPLAPGNCWGELLHEGNAGVDCVGRVLVLPHLACWREQ